MGFASYREDIERARDEVSHLKNELELARDKPADLRIRIQSLSDVCGRLIRKFDELLELATDPALSIASEVERLRKEVSDLRSLIGTRRADHDQEIVRIRAGADMREHRLNDQISELQFGLQEKTNENDKLKSRIKLLEDTLEFERKARSDFGATVERFDTPRPK